MNNANLVSFLFCLFVAIGLTVWYLRARKKEEDEIETDVRDWSDDIYEDHIKNLLQ